MPSVQSIIGMNIKLVRTKRAISQREIAGKLGIEASYLSRIETGTVPVSCERLYEIIQLLKCDISEIFPDPLEVETQFNKLNK